MGPDSVASVHADAQRAMVPYCGRPNHPLQQGKCVTTFLLTASLSTVKWTICLALDRRETELINYLDYTWLKPFHFDSEQLQECVRLRLATTKASWQSRDWFSKQKKIKSWLVFERKISSNDGFVRVKHVSERNQRECSRLEQNVSVRNTLKYLTSLQRSTHEPVNIGWKYYTLSTWCHLKWVLCPCLEHTPEWHLTDRRKT